ncbi:MAG: folate-binding protein [Cyanobacteria bacterium J06642_2]
MTDNSAEMFLTAATSGGDEVEAISSLQQQAGGTLTSLGNRAIPLSFPTDELALQAAREGVALRDRSHWGCLEFRGEERLDFLQGQTTNDLKSLRPGRGCDTCVVTSTARTIDLTTVLATADALLLLTSPQRRQTLLNWFSRLIRFSRADIVDISDTTACFELLGPESDRLVVELGGSELVGQPDASHLEVTMPDSDIRIRLVVGNGLALPGYLVTCHRVDAASVWQRIQQQAVPMGEAAWECLRVRQGRPMPDRELTEAFNPLEAGLWHAVSLNKGCYIGQETLARLKTYNGVKQHLWGLKLSAVVEPGTRLTLEGDRAGVVTSTLADESAPFGLAYVRRKYAESGLTLQVGESVAGELVELPYGRRSFD